jgi:hypothetical protein
MPGGVPFAVTTDMLIGILVNALSNRDHADVRFGKKIHRSISQRPDSSWFGFV